MTRPSLWLPWRSVQLLDGSHSIQDADDDEVAHTESEHIASAIVEAVNSHFQIGRLE